MPDETPSVFIQWKGTDVCMDFYCECGESLHFDGYFAYYVKCPFCKAVYQMPSDLTPVKVEESEADNPKIMEPDEIEEVDADMQAALQEQAEGQITTPREAKQMQRANKAESRVHELERELAAMKVKAEAETKHWDALSLDDRVKLDREMSLGRPPYVLMPGKS